MLIKYFRGSFILLILLSSQISIAQTPISESNLSKLKLAQDSLAQLSDSVYRIKDDIEKIVSNGIFVKQLVKTLKTPYSFYYNFDSLSNLSIVKPQDNSFRIITWYLPLHDGTYKFYGAIQYNTKNGTLKLTPLNDSTSAIKNENSVTTANNWFGARYYDIIPLNLNHRIIAYILLGWKGNSAKTNKKLIEILSYEKGEEIFGKLVFDENKKSNTLNRKVFEYSKSNSMTLNYDKNSGMIVFEHLIPYDTKMKGNFEYYVSDSSFDGYIIGNGRLILKENIPLKNGENNNEGEFITPIKASSKIQKGKH